MPGLRGLPFAPASDADPSSKVRTPGPARGWRVGAEGGEDRRADAFSGMTTTQPRQPNKIWWARPRKLCALERPGGGGRSHRPARRAADIDYLVQSGVRVVISTMSTRHNLADYERAGLEWRRVPVASCAEGAEPLEELLVMLRRELRGRGAVAVHGNRRTDFVAALCAAHLASERGVDPADALAAAAAAGLDVTPESVALVGVERDSLDLK